MVATGPLSVKTTEFDGPAETRGDFNTQPKHPILTGGPAK